MKSANINCWKLKNSKCTYDKEALYSCKAFPKRVKRNAMGVVRVSLTSALLKGLFEIDILYSYVGSYSLLQSWCLTSVHVYSEVLLSNQESAPRHPHLTWPVVSMAHSGSPVRVNSNIGQQKCGETIQRWVETVTATKKIPNTFMIK